MWVRELIPSLFRPFSWKLRRATPAKSATASEPTPAYGKDQVPRWIQEIAEAHRDDASSDDFINDLKQDFFMHRIFVFTPQGDVVDLPIGASPVDFAYAIHSDIGDHTSGAKVNNKLVSLDTELHNGDIVEIVTRKSSKPTAKWLDFVKTSMAQRRIRSSLGMNTVERAES
jgi:(p)ppGpp synthase/HD superfamily hydrolase